ncbi:MAG: Si-specific NAD(P)(+) transhydrogenase [Gemmatimonadaceae bacterium]|nr:Si-specific NAD(P)(+) transhydrogenase [Gemmatimonadaceae bacterium]
MSDHYDLLVIGAGPAGEKGAAQAAYFGKRVAIIERAPKPGGAAINSGTVPSKTLRETALYFSGLRQRGLYGIDVSVKHDLTIGDFMYRERAVVESQWALIEENITRHGITTIQGQARFVDAHTVEVTRFKEPARRITAEIILLATGSHPLRPASIPFDDRVVVDSDGLLGLPAIPRRLVVVGGGVIGCEYAAMFAALGVKVTIVNARAQLLQQFDVDLSGALRDALTRRLGITVLAERELREITVADGVAAVTLTDDATVYADAVLYSIGRVGSTVDLGLETAGVAVNARGFVEVDAQFRTRVPHIIAAGDVVGYPALASTAMEQARVAVCHAFGFKYKEQVSSVLPYGVWTIPELAMVGATEEQLRAQQIDYEIGRSSYRLNPRGQIVGDTEGIVKLLFRRDDQRLLGAAVLGENACELIHLPSAVIALGGTLDYFIQSVFNYPTLSDAFKYAAYDGLQRLARRIRASGGLPQKS